MVKKRNDGKSTKKAEAVDIRNIISNEKTDFLFGAILVFFAIFMLIAMISYLSTGKADQSILEHMRPGEWLNNNHQFANYCQSFGAILAYFLINVNFGLPAFVIPLFVILVGLSLMRAYRLNLWKWFLGMSVAMIWSSITFAKFLTPLLGDEIYNPGGLHGLLCVQQLEKLMGPPGLTVLLLFVALAFLTVLSAETIQVVRKALNPVQYITSKVKLTIVNQAQTESEDTVLPAKTEDKKTSETPLMEEIKPDDVVTNVVDLTEDISPRKAVAVETSSETELTKKEDDVSASTNADELLRVETTPVVETAGEKHVETHVDLSSPINPREPFLKYKFPTLNLLKKYDNGTNPEIDIEEIKSNNKRIVEVLNNFNVQIRDVKATVGPTITLYEITPAEGVRINRIRNLEDDIALSLSALGIRIIAPIPGKGTIGIEVPNKKANIVSMESILNSKKFKETTMDLPIALGKTITNDVFMADLSKIPHLLVAGATGQGKSVGLNAILTSLLYKKHPNELKIVLVDPKKVEFSVYQPIAARFMAALPENEEEPIITDVTKVVKTLNGLCVLMDRRYDLLRIAGTRNIKEYNQKFVEHRLDPRLGHEYMPYIVVVIDEFGDLIMTAGKEIEKPICRIAQLARAVGIHMVIATQRPTTNIITGTIKANFPGRMAFRVTSIVDSRTILDRKGADQLIGRGDMLIINGNEPVRVQCAFVDTPEVERINHFIADQLGPTHPLELPEPVAEGEASMAGGGTNIGALDPFFEEAAHHIVTTQQGSTSMIQRRFSIGYNRAGRLMDQLEAAGIVGVSQGSKPRDVLISDESSLNILLSKMRNG